MQSISVTWEAPEGSDKRVPWSSIAVDRNGRHYATIPATGYGYGTGTREAANNATLELPYTYFGSKAVEPVMGGYGNGYGHIMVPIDDFSEEDFDDFNYTCETIAEHGVLDNEAHGLAEHESLRGAIMWEVDSDLRDADMASGVTALDLVVEYLRMSDAPPVEEDNENWHIPAESLEYAVERVREDIAAES